MTDSGQLHITHRADYLRGRADGKADGLVGAPNLVHIVHPDTDERRAYRLGYSDGWSEANPCDNGTCGHLAHTTPA